MKHCLILAPLVLSSTSAFTINRQWNNFVTSQSAQAKVAPLKVADYDAYGNSNRIEAAYDAWCRVYNKTDKSRLEVFAYHFLLAEKFYGQTGSPIKLNEFADLTSTEYKELHEAGGVPASSVQPTEFVFSETSPTIAAEPIPIAPADYGPAAESYLEALTAASNSAVPSGAGMTSYLDCVPQNAAVGGAGMTSYLDAMNGASPVEYTPYEPPAAPAAPAQAFTPAEPAAPVATGGNYMDNLSSASTAGSPSGSGMSSYLDTVPQNSAVGGAGVSSYLDSVGGAAATEYTPFTAAPVATAPAPEPFTPPAAPSIPAAPVATGGNYMDNLSADTTAGGPSGKGMTSYLDSVPQNTAVGGGAGMSSYLDSVAGAAPAEYTPFEPAAPVAAAPAPESFTPPATPAAPFVPTQSIDIPTGGNYMDNLSTATAGGALSGAGMTSYLDSVPQNSAVSGSGTASYLDSVATAQPTEFVYEAPAPAVVEPVYAEPALAEPVYTEPVLVADAPIPEEPVFTQPVEPIIVEPQPAFGGSRNIPGAHWMDTPTPISSYGARGLNGNWDEDVQYQATNERFVRQETVAADPFVAEPAYIEPAPVKEVIQPLTSTQEAFQPAVRQSYQETFGGGFIIS